MEAKEVCEDISDVRMIKLLPHGIAEEWPTLKQAIEISLPPLTVPTESESRMTGVLEALLSGTMELHVFFKLIKGRPFSYGFIITAKIFSIESAHSNLLVYILYGHRKLMAAEEFAKCLEMTKKYARSIDCHGIIAYTKMKSVKDTFTDLGFNTEYTIMMSEV